MLDVYVDSDAHRIYPQVLHAADRYGLEVYVVTKDYLPTDRHVHLILAEEDQANAGAWIVSHIARGDIAITSDAKLAAVCLLRGAQVLTPNGLAWSAREDVPASIANAVAPGSDPVGRVPSDARMLAQRLDRAIAAGRAMGPRSFAPSSVGQRVAAPEASTSRKAPARQAAFG